MRLWKVLSVLALTLILLNMLAVPTKVSAQEPPDAETLREQERALQAEQNAGMPQGPLASFPALGVAPLFAGADVAAGTSGYVTTPPGPAWTPLISGVEVWGAAYNYDNGLLYITNGSNLYSLDPTVGGAPTLVGSITSGGVSMSVVSLAYCNSVLYTTRNISSTANPEGLYTVNPATAAATLVAAFPNTAGTDVGGLDCNPTTGILYGTNDGTTSRGLVTVDTTTAAVTLVAAYPTGETDIDGLAVGNGVAYLIEDDSATGVPPGQVYPYDLTTNTYGTSFVTPWSANETFSAGAWIMPAGPTPTPTATASATATATGTATATVVPSATATMVPSATATMVPSATATTGPTVTPPPTSIELGTVQGDASRAPMAAMLALVGLGILAAGLIVRRR